MIHLEAFGDTNPLGYVWHRTTGWRIVVVIDDMFALHEWEPAEGNEDEDFPPGPTYGLLTIRDELAELESTKAIGFFNLPDPGSANFQKEIQEIIDAIYRWINIAKNDDCRVYILIDYFYGDGDKRVNLSGTHFVESWMEQEKFQDGCQETYLPIKLAHLSVSGAPVPNPYKLEVFRKIEIQTTQKLPPKLREWLDVDEHPLIRLWRISSGWFGANYNDDDVMKHTTSDIQEYLHNPQDGRLAIYKHKVEDALGLQFPESWWQDPSSIGNIHESLKCMCGVLFCGQCEDDTTKRPISTGAAFLLALMAHQSLCGSVDTLTRNERMWLNCPKAGTSFIFAKQARHVAEDSAIALYDFFSLIFQVRNRSESGAAARISQVNNVLFADRGRILRIELSWNAHRQAIDRNQSLAEMMAEIFQSNSIQIPASPPRNTREAILRLWSLMAVSESGCLPVGSVCLENNFLTIASVK